MKLKFLKQFYSSLEIPHCLPIAIGMSVVYYLLAISFNAGAQDLKSHPEKGILPFNTPCSDCTEDLVKRTGNTREFFKVNAGRGKTIYKQQSVGDMNITDEDGFWRTADPRLIEESPKVFTARMQASPVVLDLQNRIFSVFNAGKEFRFTKNISLAQVSSSGVETDFGPGNWSRISKSGTEYETILLIEEFYPGIDLQLIAWFGRVKTNFILKSRLAYHDGYLILKQQIEIPSGLHADQSASVASGDTKRTGMLLFKDESGENYFYYSPAYAFDAGTGAGNNLEMPFTQDNNQLNYFVPVSWLNSGNTIYPVTIDPLVSTTNTLPQSSITGSGYTANCAVGGCSYIMPTFQSPAECQLTSFNSTFAYLASLPCGRSDGGFTITVSTGTCSDTSRFWTCVGTGTGPCFIQTGNLLDAVDTCIGPPQCQPFDMDFTLNFYRCNQLNIPGCDSSCIRQYTPWVVTIEGLSFETGGLPEIICGDSAVIAPFVHGVPPFSYLWSPTGDTTPYTIAVPNGPTTYTVIITDACGNTDTLSQVIEKISDNSPGFTISPSDTVCEGELVTITANSTIDSLCFWSLYCDTISYFDSTTQISFIASSDSNFCFVSFYWRHDSAGYTCIFTDTARIVIEICDLIDEPMSGGFTIHPNPASDQFTIHDARFTMEEVVIFNAIGIRLYHASPKSKHPDSNQETIDSRRFAPGIYFVKVKTEKGWVVKKIIIN